MNYFCVSLNFELLSQSFSCIVKSNVTFQVYIQMCSLYCALMLIRYVTVHEGDVYFIQYFTAIIVYQRHSQMFRVKAEMKIL